MGVGRVERVGLGARGMAVVWGGGRVLGRRVEGWWVEGWTVRWAGVVGCWGKAGSGGWRVVRCTSGLRGRARRAMEKGMVMVRGKGRRSRRRAGGVFGGEGGCRRCRCCCMW